MTNINFMQIEKGGHCFKCHKDFEEFGTEHMTSCKAGEPTPGGCDSCKIPDMFGRTKYWDTMVNILDKQFPKGQAKERGAALVMLAHIEMMLQGLEFDDDGEPRDSERLMDLYYGSL